MQYQIEISNLKDNRLNADAVLLQGKCTREQYKDRKDELDIKEVVTNISIHEAEMDWFDMETTVIYVTTFIGNLSRTWFDLPREMRPQFQKLIFPDGVFVDADKKLRTTRIGSIYKLIDQSTLTETEFCYVVDPWRFELHTS